MGSILTQRRWRLPGLAPIRVSGGGGDSVGLGVSCGGRQPLLLPGFLLLVQAPAGFFSTALFQSGCQEDKPLQPSMGSAGAGESSDEGNWFPLGFSPSALPSVILAGRGCSRDPPRLLQPRRWTVKPGRGSDAIPALLVPREVLVAPVMPVSVPMCREGSPRCPGEERGPRAGEAVPSETDGGAPATPGPMWGEEPWEGAGLPEPRPTLPPAWGHVTAWPAPPRRPVRTAPLQLLMASGRFFGPLFVSGPAPFGPPFVCLWICSHLFQVRLLDGCSSILAPARLWLLFVSALVPVQQMDGSSPSSLRLQLMDGSGSFLLLFLVAPAHLHLQFWLQLICGSCLFLLWFQSSRWTAPAPAHRGSSSWMALARSSPSSLWLQLICTFGFGSSSFAAPVCFCSGFSPAHGRLQLDSSSFGLQLMDGSGSFQPLFLVAAAHLHLQVQLLVGSSWVSSPGQFWLQPIDGSSSFSPPALGWFQFWLQPQPITACACSTAPGFWPGRKSITVMACI
ncbi:uncharacterized protein LOC141743752 isoform X1 [Larus michahellis]|uniref:uncharacterized protein LOC141743752 isoform X1 n=1 Tax=Larus michahellis TaxID=119627 RepID=UPI003D9B10B1